MDLPNEIILQIVQSLEKCDLKSVRLVFQTWIAFATERLFDRVYVSAHSDNLEVFKAITQHTILSKCVKTLIYDAVDFVENYSKTQYVCDLSDQTWSYPLDDSSLESSKAPSSDSEIKAWMVLVKPDPQSFMFRNVHEVQRACKDYEFIDCGYQKYQRYAAFQRLQSNNGNFVESLVGGLQKLENLSCVVMEDKWPSFRHSEKLLSGRPSGSPLARNWNNFHTEPRGWEWEPNNYG